MGLTLKSLVMLPLAGLVMAPALARQEGAAPEPVAAADKRPCPAQAAALPADLVGWSAPSVDRVMTKYYPNSHWLRGLNTRLGLYPVQDVAFVATPEKTPEAGTYGGMMAVRVHKAGRLRIALADRAWVDLVKGATRETAKTGKKGVLVPSAEHGHGPDCSGIAKIVDYDVEPGRYVIQIVNAPAAKIQAMAVAPR